jgi:hypothetical protein
MSEEGLEVPEQGHGRAGGEGARAVALQPWLRAVST